VIRRRISQQRSEGVGLRSVRTVTGAVALSVVGALALTGCGGGSHPAAKRTHAPHPTATVSAPPTALTVGLFGTGQEIAAYRQAVDNYDAAQRSITVTVKTWPTAAAMMKDLAAGQPAPDVFLADRGDLDVLSQDKTIQPVDDLLAAREVDLGDGYTRESLEAFSADRHLMCMPYSASPRVLYYNTDIIDFPAMKAAGVATPSDPDSGKWTVQTFAAAVTWADQQPGVRAFSTPSTIEDLAPYLYSGQGEVVDNEQTPTTLAFSDPSNDDTWTKILPVLSTPGAALTPKQLKKHTPLQWFERGKLGMLVGDRSLVPELRKHSDLHWDVISLPSVAGTSTIGDYTGLCLSAQTKQTQAAADLLAYLVSNPAVALVSRAGSIVPVNNAVAASDAFLQPTQQPAHAKVFVTNGRSMHVLPIPSETLATLDGRVGGLISRLFQQNAAVPGITGQIDSASQPIFSALNASLSPSPTPTATPTD